MEATQTENRRRNDRDGGAYAPPEVEAFCDPYPAEAPRSFSPAAFLSGPRQRRYRSEELCRSRREDRENLLRSSRKDFAARQTFLARRYGLEGPLAELHYN